MFYKGALDKITRPLLIYFALALFLGALFYTSRWSIVRILYKAVSIPMRLLFSIIGWMGIVCVLKHLGKCVFALIVSVIVSVGILLYLPNVIPYMEKWILANSSKPEEAYHMFLFCAFLFTVLCGMLIMYVLLRMMFVVFITGDRKCKVKIFNKIWNEMKLFFYVVSIILQFVASINSGLAEEIKYFVEAVIFIMLLDSYIDKRKDCVS